MAIYAYGKRVPEIDETAWVFPTASVIGKVTLEGKVYVGAGAVLRGDYGSIIVKSGSAIEENTTIHARMAGTCFIEQDVTVGHAAMLHNCTIKKGAVIGMNATVSDHAIVGEGTIIAEGAVVKAKSDIPPFKIAAGVPAQVIGDVPEAHKEFWLAAKEVYKALCRDYKRKLKRLD
ncbi:gamma carbonic anhydrase family protein [Candidatus Bathyarchaeota archaeon]|nr:gamma carbonic anhydrase family protein [Candidatus Bathyarchaeota archaeon]